MKYILLSIVFLSIFGCGWFRKEAKTPEEVLITFLEALKKKDFYTAKLYSTPKTKIFLEVIENPSSLGVEQTTEQAQEENLGQLLRVKAVKCRTQVDTAMCAACLETKNCVNPSAFIRLQRTKGHWQVLLID